MEGTQPFASWITLFWYVMFSTNMPTFYRRNVKSKGDLFLPDFKSFHVKSKTWACFKCQLLILKFVKLCKKCGPFRSRFPIVLRTYFGSFDPNLEQVLAQNFWVHFCQTKERQFFQFFLPFWTFVNLVVWPVYGYRKIHFCLLLAHAKPFLVHSFFISRYSSEFFCQVSVLAFSYPFPIDSL